MKKLLILALMLFPLALRAQIPIDQDWARFSRYEAEPPCRCWPASVRT